MTANRNAFRQVIRACEGTLGDEGYRALFGWRPGNGKVFNSFADHPRQYFPYTDLSGTTVRTSAAGAYQATATTWDDFIRNRGPHDFTPKSQDEFADWLIEKCGATEDVDAGRLREAIDKCGGRWASLPSSTVPQPRRTYQFCVDAFLAAGGTLAGTLPPGTQPAAPIEDHSTTYQEPTPEGKTMGPLAILQMFGPVLAGLIPQIANIVKPQSESAKRDAALASTVVNTIVSAANAPNMQAAVEKMQADPAVVETVKKAVVTEPKVMAALQVVEVGGGAAAAAERDLKAVAAEKPFWKASAVFWISVLLMPMVYWLVGSLIVGGTAERLVAAAKETAMVPEWVTLLLSLFGPEWQGETRSGGFNLVIGLVLGGICGVYFGVSVTQQKQGQAATPSKEA